MASYSVVRILSSDIEIGRDVEMDKIRVLYRNLYGDKINVRRLAIAWRKKATFQATLQVETRSVRICTASSFCESR